MTWPIGTLLDLADLPVGSTGTLSLVVVATSIRLRVVVKCRTLAWCDLLSRVNILLRTIIGSALKHL